MLNEHAESTAQKPSIQCSISTSRGVELISHCDSHIVMLYVMLNATLYVIILMCRTHLCVLYHHKIP